VWRHQPSESGGNNQWRISNSVANGIMASSNAADRIWLAMAVIWLNDYQQSL